MKLFIFFVNTKPINMTKKKAHSKCIQAQSNRLHQPQAELRSRKIGSFSTPKHRCHAKI